MARFPSVGEEFAGYRVVRQLGRGGMGVVFAAEHLVLGRTVALKVLAPELATQDDYRRRFSREASVLARLDSPHVVQVLDHGESDGCLYIATQYVAGGDLAQALRRHGPVPVPQALELCQQVAWALGDSHAAGVVHRDVKPSNVLLRDVSDEVFVYLCDFGIAQDRDPGFTATGAVAGTFAYLAPERLRGEQATPATDVYALGCVLFAALVGQAPYAGSDVEIGMSHLNAPVPQLAEDSPLAAGVNAVLRRSMAKDPAERYPDARTMRADLRELVRLAGPSHPPVRPAVPAAGSPTTVHRPAALAPLAPPSPPPSGPPPGWAPPPSYAGSEPSRPRRRRAVAVVVAAVVAVVAVLGGVAAAVVVGGGDREAGGDPTTSATSTTSDPTTTTAEPTPTDPTTTTTEPAPSPTPAPPSPTPTYPDVAAASGPRVSLGPASLRAPAGWGPIDQGVVEQGVGARDYSDFEGYYSSVFLRRSRPPIPLSTIELLRIAARSSAESLDENDDGIELKDSKMLKDGWLDGSRAARVQASYYSPADDLSFVEETWFAQRGPFLYRLTFQHSLVDTQAERRGQIDPMVVSFRWS
ncbi:serine/threonine-protein kinase [Nocardioides litoris]|uniref:serine/threonine-protein kinase n=1 Tax=Nocardioides litoris TaxID=1926648 RepID=UPI001120962A|nr:serine/threonine-protein kinase [Nocardioides litoris]